MQSMQKLSSVKLTSEAGLSPPASGATMDRKVNRKGVRWKHPLVAILVVLVIVTVFLFWDRTAQRTLAIERAHISISSVQQGIFEDFIPVRGRIVPSKTLYLDAVEGGRVERVLVEDGAILQAGDLIAELSNTSLQLTVLSNEARVAEQLNTIRTIELDLEQNRLAHKRNLIDINYQIKLLTRKVAKEKTLLASNAVSQNQFEDTQDTLLWYQQRLALTKESQASDTRMQEEQLAFLKQTGERLEHNLAISRQTLNNMNLRAPVDGVLSGFDIEVGQSIGEGERIGQIDVPNDFKVSALIDEFYLNRISVGQQAQFDDFQLTISKVYPQVQNGQFEVDLAFSDSQPTSIRRGQSLQMKLTLGDTTPALLIPNGAFYSDTGGNWVFVVDDTGNTAQRRSVRLGRRNAKSVEVIAGLSPGDKVITSTYASYLDMQILSINQ